MKKYITYLLATALVGSAFVSCTERLQEGEMRISTHKVHFAASNMETRTGLSIDGTTVTPDWNKTALESIHLFEIDANEAVAYGETITITTSEDKATAHFEADFLTDMSIIVNPSDPGEDSGAKGTKGTKGTRVSPYRYAAIIAQKPDKNNFTFVVPAEQHPNAETLKDPDADFLIGYSRKAYDTEHFFDEPVVDLYFDRVAALGRLAISNFAEGEKVQSVTINAQNGLTGSASYADIDFENGSVSFVREEGPGILTLVYDGGMDIPADGPFYAYFVAIPGSATLTSVEVVTDQYRYTKTIEGGKELTFSEKAFKSMNLDLSTATREEVAPSGLTWYKASMLEDGIDYIIVSNGYALKNNGSKAVVAAQAVEIVDGTISLEETEGLIWTANANSEFTEYGTHTLSNGTEHLWRHSDNGTFTLEANNEAITKYMVWNYDGEYLWNISIYTGSSSAQISDYYAYYSSGWKISTTKTAATLFTNRAPQTMAFSEATINYDVDAGGDFTEPELTGAKTAVTYSSSNEAVASVDPATGEVTIKKAGTVTITAAAAGNAEYQAGTASYTIVASSSAIDTFYLASEIVAGESYMVVSGGYAVTTDGSTLGTVPVTVTDGIIQISAAEVALFEAAAHIEYYEGTSIAGHYTLTNGGKYLQRHSDGNTQEGAIGAENGKYYVWDYDGEHLYQISRTGNSGTYYFYYSSGWTFDYQSAKNAYLYTTTKQLLPQHLSFSSESVTAVLGQPFTAPTLSGVKTTVSYASSDANVATIASDGTVTLVGVGTTTITATAAASDEYNAGSASYTLKVTDGSAPTWYKAEEIEDGQSYIVISNGSALKNNSSSLAAETNSLFTGDSFQYEAESDLIWLVTGNSSSFTLKNDGKYLRRSSGGTLQISSTNSSNTCTYDGSYVKIATSYVLYCNDGSWTTGNSTNDSRKVSFYTSTPPRQAQTLSFSATSVTYDVAGSAAFTAPTLSGAQTAVTYSSSNAAVATVNATTGAVEIVGTGTTIITANAEGTDAFKPATASYTLRVTDSSAPVTTKRYVLASSIEAGKEYLIVSNGMALQNNNKAEGAYPVTVENSQIELDEDAASTVLWTASADGNNRYNFSNNSSFLVRSSSNITIGEKNSTDRYNQWALDDSNHLGAATGGNTLYPLGYDGSSSKWTAKDGNSVTASLYTVEDP